jgi:hypothetical protein
LCTHSVRPGRVLWALPAPSRAWRPRREERGHAEWWRPYPAFLPSFYLAGNRPHDQGRQMLEIAAGYDRLAERAEERLRS